jgi:hypothetical protein
MQLCKVVWSLCPLSNCRQLCVCVWGGGVSVCVRWRGRRRACVQAGVPLGGGGTGGISVILWSSLQNYISLFLLQCCFVVHAFIRVKCSHLRY